MGEDLRIWIAVRADLAMPAGKIAVQVAHAAAAAIWHGDNETVGGYMAASQAKIVVSVRGGDELMAVRDIAIANCVPAYLIVDAGRTVFAAPTATCVAIGPTTRDKLPPRIKRLRLWRDDPLPEKPRGEG